MSTLLLNKSLLLLGLPCYQFFSILSDYTPLFTSIYIYIYIYIWKWNIEKIRLYEENRKQSIPNVMNLFMMAKSTLKRFSLKTFIRTLWWRKNCHLNNNGNLYYCSSNNFFSFWLSCINWKAKLNWTHMICQYTVAAYKILQDNLKGPNYRKQALERVSYLILMIIQWHYIFMDDNARHHRVLLVLEF